MSYNRVSRLLHRLALGNAVVPEMAFDLERATAGKTAPAGENGQHVFVSGLARSGTTILLRLLHATGAFATLTYRDMPFVLAPNLWAAVAGRWAARGAAFERPHGDGLKVDYDTPEAFEEVFWRVFEGDAYIRPDALVPMTADPRTVAAYRDYVALVLKRAGGSRYLAKNNYNVLRLPALREAFPRATILIPFRAPLDHAASLRAQHRRFKRLAARDSFTSAYMRWLGHYEFGPQARPIATGVAPKPQDLDPDGLDHWLAQWVNVYEHVARELPPLGDGVLPIAYERLCGAPAEAWATLARHLDLPARLPAAERIVPAAQQVDRSEADPALLRAAEDLYDRLAARQPEPLAPTPA